MIGLGKEVLLVMHSLALAQLRTSAQNLATETGRYARPAVPSCERKCKLDEMEDEVHFLNRCTAYEEDSREPFGNVGGPQQEASDTDTFVWLCRGQKNRSWKPLESLYPKNFNVACLALSCVLF